MKPELLQLQRALQNVLRWHASNKWCRIAPIELLQCFFNLTTKRYGMLAGQQQDALECFKLFHTALGKASNIDAEFCDVPLQYPSGLPPGAHNTIAHLLNLIATEKGIIGASEPPALVLSVLP